MDGEPKKAIRLSWEEWQSRRAARREALTRKGLSTACRRSTAKPKTLAALEAFLCGLKAQNPDEKMGFET